jgi:hypothetical protein
MRSRLQGWWSRRRSGRAVPLAAALAVSAALPAAAQTPARAGPEFQVNSWTSGSQFDPGAAAQPDGDFVVVWASYGSAGTDDQSYSIQGQRFDAQGGAQGGEFQVNSYTTGFQVRPSVGRGAGGGFVVVWQSQGSSGSDGDAFGILGQRYASDGTPVGGEFQVNTTTSDSQESPAVAVGDDGSFVVVWHSVGSAGDDASSTSVQGQRYASDGATAGGEFQVNTYTTSSQSYPAVAVDAFGDFVVVWQSFGSAGADTSNRSILGQRYASDGTALGGEFEVNDYTTNAQRSPAVAVTPDGDFVVTWGSLGSYGTDSSDQSIQARRYASDGTPLGGEFQVNTYTSGAQGYPAIAADSAGGFTVVWQGMGSSASDTSARSVHGQRYASDGAPLGVEFQVNTYTTGNQSTPVVAGAADGDLAVAWASAGSSGSDTSLGSVQAQRFKVGVAASLPALPVPLLLAAFAALAAAARAALRR